MYTIPDSVWWHVVGVRARANLNCHIGQCDLIEKKRSGGGSLPQLHRSAARCGNLNFKLDPCQWPIGATGNVVTLTGYELILPLACAWACVV